MTFQTGSGIKRVLAAGLDICLRVEITDQLQQLTTNNAYLETSIEAIIRITK